MKDICSNTGRPCSGCQPGACSFRLESRLTIEQLLYGCNTVCERELYCGSKGQYNYIKHDSIRTYLNELQRYKELEAVGRLIELPCKVGEYVWMIKEFGSLLFPKENKTPKVIKTVFLHKHIPLFGYSVFFTKEEAEAKLAELKGGE